MFPPHGRCAPIAPRLTVPRPPFQFLAASTPPRRGATARLIPVSLSRVGSSVRLSRFVIRAGRTATSSSFLRQIGGAVGLAPSRTGRKAYGTRTPLSSLHHAPFCAQRARCSFTSRAASRLVVSRGPKEQARTIGCLPREPVACVRATDSPGY